MLIILIAWLIIGIIVAYLKLRQSRHLGFDRRINFATLPFFAIGVLLWPLILILIYHEKKMHEEAHFRANMEESEFDRELDEIERELDE